MHRNLLALATVLTSLALTLTLAYAASTGQIKGLILDKDSGEPVIGATVLVVGTTMGAMTDPDGKYQILRLEPGTYTLRISHMNYVTSEVFSVAVVADSTVEVDRQLIRKVTNLDETITCIGTTDIQDKFQVDSRSAIPRQIIKQRPVQTVDALLEQVAGVKTTADREVFIRGGRAGEVAYIVDGVPLTSQRGVVNLSSGVINPPPAHGGSAIVNGEPFDAMFFKNHGVNPFVDTEDDHYSTFAVDVDDASYVLTRSCLERGHLPPEDAVRVEEFVNHFDYAYDSPVHDAFRVTIEAAPSRFGTDNTYLLRVGVKGRVVSPEDRKPANLVFVVDISGSMSREDRLGLVRKSLHLLMDQLTPEDQIGIVVYGSDAHTLLSPTSASKESEIREAINSLRSNGATYAAKGIRLGYEMADKMFDSEKINRVILCSDGVANVGQTSPDDILKQIKKYADKGITLTSVGFGMGNYNDILLEKLGNKGNGFYAYVDDLTEARRLFSDNAVATLQVIAREVKTQVDFNPEVVRSYRLLGYENRDVDDDKFRDNKEDGGEIGAGHDCTALFELKLHRGLKSDLVATVFMRHQDPDTREFTEVNYPYYLSGFTTAFDDASTDFRLAATAAEFAEILRGSYWARGSELEAVARDAEAIYDRTGDSDVEELIRLIKAAEGMQEQLAER